MRSGEKAVAHVVGDLAQDVQKRMPLATPESLQDDRINAWSNDLGDHAECSSTLQVLSCGGTTRAPMNYLADMQTKGAIMLDSREGPVLMDDDGEDPSCMCLCACVYFDRVFQDAIRFCALFIRGPVLRGSIMSGTGGRIDGVS